MPGNFDKGQTTYVYLLDTPTTLKDRYPKIGFRFSCLLSDLILEAETNPPNPSTTFKQWPLILWSSSCKTFHPILDLDACQMAKELKV